MDLAVLVQAYEFRVVINLTVYGDAYSVELRRERRKPFDKAAQQLVDTRCVDRNLGDAARRGGPAAGQEDSRHVIVRTFDPSWRA